MLTVSREISEKLRLRLTGEEKERAIRQQTDNPEAYRLYLKGLYYWYQAKPEGYEKSRDYFQQAIDKDPTYARAYIGLSWYYAILADDGLSPPSEAWPKAREAVLKAQEIDSTLAEVPLGLGSVKLLYEWDWPGAEREYTKALQLSLSAAEVYREYS